MYNLIISVVVALLVTVAIKLAGFSYLAAILPGTLALLVTFVLLARRVAMRVQAISMAAQKELSVQPTNAKDRQVRIERAIKTLESGLVYDKWQILIGAELHAQIGMIHYVSGNLAEAERHLSLGHSRNYMAKAIQGALYYRQKKYDEMKQSFEVAVKAGKKDSLVWASYAWCLDQLKRRDEALAVMGRALQINPADEKLKASVSALQNDKRLKMRAYEPNWWQLGLEQPPLQAMGGGRQVRYQRR